MCRAILPFFLVAALVVTLHAAPSRAQPDQSKALSLVKAAKSMYKDGKYELALDLFGEAHQILSSPKVEYSIGLCLMKLERWLDALALWERLKDEETLATARPKIEGFVATCEAHVFGALHILQVPDGAKLFLDGEETPAHPTLHERMPAGEHKVRIEHPDFHEWESSVTVDAGRKASISVVPRPRFGTVELSGLPKGAQVVFDGAMQALGSAEIPRIEEGWHRVEVWHKDYEPWSEAVDVKAGVVTRVQPTLVFLPSKLTIHGASESARVFLDETPVGAPPVEKYEVAPGTHDLVVTDGPYRRFERTLEFGPGQDIEVDVSFEGPRSQADPTLRASEQGERTQIGQATAAETLPARDATAVAPEAAPVAAVPEPTPVATAPEPAPVAAAQNDLSGRAEVKKKKGLSTTAWVLIGTGAAALVGGGLAAFFLLRDGGSIAADDDTWVVR